MEMVTLLCYGFLQDLSGLTVLRDCTGQGIKAIIEDILDQDVLPFSDVTYNSNDIEDPGYSVESISLNHTAQDAMTFLAAIAGNYEWGVDLDKSFFFKAIDTNVKHVFILGQDVQGFTEERQDDSIINDLTVFAAGGLQVNVVSSLSISRFGRKKFNLFETSITGNADAVRLGRSYVKQYGGFRRSIKFDLIRDDLFIEENTPIGSIAVNKKQFRNRPKYGTTHKYGRNIKYGNLKRDQLGSITYELINGGIRASATLYDDVPNIGDLQKRNEFEIKELQRR
jgi:hypothetical protein